MAIILKPDRTTTKNNVTVNEYLLTEHYKAVSYRDMPNVIGITIHNTEWITVADGTTPAEQYTRATANGNMGEVIVHYYVDNKCAWQNLPHNVCGVHAADGAGDGNRKTIAIECIMSGEYNDRDKASEDNAARLAAALLSELGMTTANLYTHEHWYPPKYCPCYILPHWNKFVEKVRSYMGTIQAVPEQMYRVRQTWSNAKTQLGAYRILQNAIDNCKDGYKVYDNNGNVVYPQTVVTDCMRVNIEEIRELSIGMKGKDVEAMQAILINKGYSCGPYGSDADFGQATENALRNFQTEHKLDTTGVCNAKTWKELIEK